MLGNVRSLPMHDAPLKRYHLEDRGLADSAAVRDAAWFMNRGHDRGHTPRGALHADDSRREIHKHIWQQPVLLS